ncbi:EpsG family protein [Agarivorans sp. Z349TD_8]|uniref:EpsG family protein n=1 Tax=Agarivorans sp. Z349TD_8 TaxID=3421434 RepID=UPI003D7C4BBC
MKLFLILAFFLFFLIFYIKKPKHLATSFLCFCLVILFSFLASSREFGVVSSDDAVEYFWYYKYLREGGVENFFREVTFEPVFSLFYIVSSHFVSTEREMLFFFSLLCNFILCLCFYNYKGKYESVFICFLLFSNTSLLFYETQLIRQTLSLALFLCFLSSRRYRRAFLFLSFFTHFSVLFFYLFFILGGKVLDCKKTVRLPLFFMATFFTYTLVTIVFSYILSFMGGLAPVLANKADYYNVVSSSHFNYKLVVVVGLPSLIFLFFGKKGDEFQKNVVSFYTGCVLFTLGGSAVPQLSERFFVACLILFPLAVFYCIKSYVKLAVYARYSLYVGMFILFFYKLFFSITSSQSGFSLLNGDLAGKVF